ncbi:DUF883 family protein [Pseudooceanicola algae]|uniref:DUF883 domain-containing protein n=1 Tax=Pseudooceanicola algae TaxID=1537215 RepID=A0A418SH24_9RHOB|nr:DUF883 family protein [Pseudooceanicola algae]QPM90349.1 hypothetical protein PSAL_015870 [Pseudooceanicola algae]
MAEASIAKTSADEKNPNGPTDSADVQAQLRELRNDVSELTKLLGEYGQAQKSYYTGAARAKAEQLKGDAEASYFKAEEQAREAYAQAESKIRENPGASVAIASGVGFLVGLLMSRR